MDNRRQRGFSLIELLIVVAIIGIIAAIAIPNLLKAQQAARETSSLKAVQSIGEAQILYSVTKGHGKFTDLATLGAEHYIEQTMASGTKSGYQFTSVAITTEGMPSMFDTSAKPGSTGPFGTGNRSFYANETNVIYEADGGTPPTATPQDRVPKDGTPIQ